MQFCDLSKRILSTCHTHNLFSIVERSHNIYHYDNRYVEINNVRRIFNVKDIHFV